jgi:hypothetical protein
MRCESTLSMVTFVPLALNVRAINLLLIVAEEIPIMDDKVAYWASVTLGALALLIVVTHIVFTSSNRTLQAEVNQNQLKINSAVNLSQLNKSLVQALADASVKQNDKDIRDLLASQGITVKAKDSGKDTTDDSKKK